LNEALENPGARSSERRRLLETMFGDTLDGRSSGRVAAALLELALAPGNAAKRRSPNATGR